jgi:hypothetical protein
MKPLKLNDESERAQLTVVALAAVQPLPAVSGVIAPAASVTRIVSVSMLTSTSFA